MKDAVLVIVSIVLAPCWAFAQNGLVLINQSTVASSGANRATGGFPYVITQPGSYQLSGNLTVPPGVNGIVISASFVSLDLNGFNISCVGSCSGDGITDNGTPRATITIRNGTVFGFNNGINLGSNGSFIEKVTAQSNRLDGIQVGDSSTIKDGFALNNTVYGISAGIHSIVSGNVASGNGLGMQVGSGTLTGNTADSNSGTGIIVLSNGTLNGNTANSNGAIGIFITTGSLTGNIVSNNHTNGIEISTGTLTGNTANNNAGDGINAGSGSTLTGNTASSNGMSGFAVPQGSTVTGNTASSNRGNGFSVAKGSTLTGNTASSNSGNGFFAVCPVNLVGNTSGGNLGFPYDLTTGVGCKDANNLNY